MCSKIEVADRRDVQFLWPQTEMTFIGRKPHRQHQIKNCLSDCEETLLHHERLVLLSADLCTSFIVSVARLFLSIDSAVGCGEVGSACGFHFSIPQALVTQASGAGGRNPAKSVPDGVEVDSPPLRQHSDFLFIE